MSKKQIFIGLAIAIIITILDLASKKFVFDFLDSLNLERPEIVVTSFFSLVQVWNKGISFGMMNNLTYGKYIILAVNLSIILVLFVWLYKNKITYISVALGLIIGGAFGNIIDRIINHAVADFLDFHIAGYHWPAFNLADSAVFIGVALLLLENFFVKEEKNEK